MSSRAATGEASGFTPELFTFLRRLRRNNNREWFNRNKAVYEEMARDPALRFISAFAAPLYEISPHFTADPRPTRGSLFRIYRDTRFASDKRPYKTHIGMHFSHSTAKDVHAPIFYLHLEPENCFAAGGIWHPDSRTLTRVRAAILADPAGWGKISRRYELEGDQLSRPPRGCDPKHPFIEDLKRKDFVASVVFTEDEVCHPRFLRRYTEACRKLAPLVEFTACALGLKF